LNLSRGLAGKGRVLLRPSGTEPVVRVMVKVAEAIAAVVKATAEPVVA
jgi:phosphomannomutase